MRCKLWRAPATDSNPNTLFSLLIVSLRWLLRWSTSVSCHEHIILCRALNAQRMRSRKSKKRKKLLIRFLSFEACKTFPLMSWKLEKNSWLVSLRDKLYNATSSRGFEIAVLLSAAVPVWISESCTAACTPSVGSFIIAVMLVSTRYHNGAEIITSREKILKRSSRSDPQKAHIWNRCGTMHVWSRDAVPVARNGIV